MLNIFYSVMWQEMVLQRCVLEESRCCVVDRVYASGRALRLKGNYTFRGEMPGTKPCVLKVVSPTHYGPDGGNER